MSIPQINFRTPTMASLRPSALMDAARPSLFGKQDVSEIGGAVVGGVCGYTMGSGIGHMFGPVGSVLLGLGGAYYMGNWGQAAGLKTAACVMAGSIILGQVGQMVLGPIGGIAGSFGGAILGGKIAARIGNKPQQQP